MNVVATLTCVSTVFRHRRSLSASASGREGMPLLLVTLGSVITDPKESLTRWMRDLRRQDRACRDADTVVYCLLSCDIMIATCEKQGLIYCLFHGFITWFMVAATMVALTFDLLWHLYYLFEEMLLFFLKLCHYLYKAVSFRSVWTLNSSEVTRSAYPA